MALNYVTFHGLHFMVNSWSFHLRFMALSAVVNETPNFHKLLISRANPIPSTQPIWGKTLIGA